MSPKVPLILRNFHDVPQNLFEVLMPRKHGSGFGLVKGGFRHGFGNPAFWVGV